VVLTGGLPGAQAALASRPGEARAVATAGEEAMSQTESLTLDQIGVSPEFRERAKILWGINAVSGLWGWIICSFVWKLPGQEDDPWFQHQLEQAKFAGLAGWVGYLICFFPGVLINAFMGGMGFVTINKGQDYRAAMIADMVDKGAPALSAGGGAGEQRPAPAEPTTQESPQDLLAPIEGVAYQTWAWAFAHVCQGHPVDDIIGRVQIDRARWNRVHSAWQQRMAQDTSHTILNEYRGYMGQPAQPAAQQQPAQQQPAQQQEQRPAAAQVQAQPQQRAPAAQAGGAEPAPLERWVEVSVALEIGQAKGWDSTQLLGNFGMNAHDWASIDAWWSQRFRVSTGDQAFLDRYNQLQSYYNDYYSSR
jgi:hypothetical protein